MNDYLKAVPAEPVEPPPRLEAAFAAASPWLADGSSELPQLLAPPPVEAAPEALPEDVATAQAPPPPEAPAADTDEVDDERAGAYAGDDGEATTTSPIVATIEVFGAADGDAWPTFEADLLLCSDALSPPATPGCAVELLPSTLPELDARLGAAGDCRVAIAIAGDPLSVGPGRRLLAALGPERVCLHAAVGPLQAALARIGFGLGDVHLLDLDLLGAEGVLARLRRGRLYAFMPGQFGSPAVGRLLEQAGLHQARAWRVAADPAVPVEALLAFELSDRPAPDPDSGFVIAYTVGADGSSREWPGIPAAEFEAALPEAARLLALAWLQPGDDDSGWSVEGEEPALALDWSRERPEARIHCVGASADRLAHLARSHLAGHGLTAVDDGSFRSLSSLPEPNVVFLRAGPEFTQQVRTAFDRLRPSGRMVVAAEGEQSRLELMQFAHRHRPALWQDLTVSAGDGAGRFELAAARSVRLMGWLKAARG
ncbi:MAG: hypothetical protein KDH15_07795 [Rhodocyclaceae bacterium]|nr:hypothetical protein [Rhodocyclaceae bacterium]